MNTAMLQEQVAEKIQMLYQISQDLETLFPGRHYTPDGHMIGSIGEALAASFYGLDLFVASKETHDAKAPDGRLVQIKATQIQKVSLSSEPEWLLVLKIHPDGTFSEEYNGPGDLVWAHCGKCRKMGSGPFPLPCSTSCKQKFLLPGVYIKLYETKVMSGYCFLLATLPKSCSVNSLAEPSVQEWKPSICGSYC